MSHSFEVYIDESGCEGFKFRPFPEPGSPQWFVLSAVIVHQSKVADMMRLVDTTRARLSNRGVPSDLHFADLTHHQRVAWIDTIANSPSKSASVLVNKPELKERAIFKAKDRLYFYAVRLLLERVSWCCREQHDGRTGDGTAKLIFSKRKKMSYDELSGYLTWLRFKTPTDDWERMVKKDIQIDWRYINLKKIEALPHNARAGLRMADAVCSGLRYALEYSPYGFTEHRFAKMLRPHAYCRKKNYLSYGMKFFPKPPEDDPFARERYRWVDKYYAKEGSGPPA
jgi:hypothetical protein